VTDPKNHSHASRAATIPAKAKSRSELWGWVAKKMAPAVSLPLKSWLIEEYDNGRFYLWLSVFFACGIGAYFAAEHEPWWPAPTLTSVILGILAWRARNKLTTQTLLIALTTFMLGFAIANMRTATIAPNSLKLQQSLNLEGWIETVEHRTKNIRLTVRLKSLEGLGEDQTPKRLRINVPLSSQLKAGDFISTRARLYPPPSPSIPGGYDFARDAFFKEIGAVGFTRSPVQAEKDSPSAPLSSRLWAIHDQVRSSLHNHIVAMAGGSQNAEVAAALITGKRAAIDENIEESLQDSGLYHILSISGLHLMLFGGALFLLARAVLALNPNWAEHWPIKKIAAVITMLGVISYAALSGLEVATERALIMMLVALSAILLDRSALSMRNVATSAIVVLIHRPESLLTASFQLSFMAVIALLAAYESGLLTGMQENKNKSDISPENRMLWLLSTPYIVVKKTLFWVRLSVLSSLIATIATTPLISYHFQRMNPLGILSNTVSEPLVSFIIMPSGLLGLLLMPFGWDGPIWRLMAWGCEALIYIANGFADTSLAVIRHPAFPAVAILFMALGMIWISFWRSPLKWLSILLAGAGFVLSIGKEQPIARIESSGITIAVRTKDNLLSIINPTANTFAADQWLSADGDPRTSEDATLSENVSCEKGVCRGTMPNQDTWMVVRNARSIREGCKSAALLIVPNYEVYQPCASKAIIDKKKLTEEGSVAVYLTKNGNYEIKSVRPIGTKRPWHP
jgi:competence protein ComEC